MSASRIKLLLFAGMRAELGRDTLELAWASGTVEQLRAALIVEFPALARWGHTVMIARGNTYLRGDDLVQAGDEIALVPPVSGG